MITPLKLFGPPDNLGVFEYKKSRTSARLIHAPKALVSLRIQATRHGRHALSGAPPR